MVKLAVLLLFLSCTTLETAKKQSRANYRAIDEAGAEVLEDEFDPAQTKKKTKRILKKLIEATDDVE